MAHSNRKTPLITPRAVNELLDHLSSDSTLAKIGRMFTDAGVGLDQNAEVQETGQRRHLARQHLATLDLCERVDAEKLLLVFQDVLFTLEDQKANAGNNGQAIAEAEHRRTQLLRSLERSGVTRTDHHLYLKNANVPAEPLTALALKLDSAMLQRLVNSMNENVEAHPELAIGLAKDLLETVCKTILEARGVLGEGKQALPQLVKTTSGALKLLPKEVPEHARGAGTLKQLMSNLGSMAQGLAELRNLYGTGHGRSARTKSISSRHARLAAGTASTLAVFLWETHLERPLS